MKGILLLFVILSFSLVVHAQVSSSAVVPLVAFACDPATHACSEGALPNSLVQASDGNFYGSTSSSNDGSTQVEGGSIFKITPSGVVTLLFTFRPNQGGVFLTGSGPNLEIEGNDGFLYGFADGGPSNEGVVFKISKTGVFKVLHAFCSLANCADGASPSPALFSKEATATCTASRAVEDHQV